MKKVVCLLMIFQLILFFGLGSDALAGKKKIVVANTEWSIQGTPKVYLCVDADNPPFASGPYIGSMVGAVGLAQFGEPDEVSTGTISPMVVANIGDVVPPGSVDAPPALVITGAAGYYNLESYTLKKNTVTSTMGNLCIEHPVLGILEEYPTGTCADPAVFGDMNAVFKFTKKGTFTGSVEYRNEGPPCVDTVISVSGKLLGTFADE